MRRHPSTAVSSIDQQDANQRKRKTEFIVKKRSKSNVSRASVAFWGLVAVLTGVLLLCFPGTSPLAEEDEVAAFMNWFRAAGGNVSSKIAIQTFTGMGRGAFSPIIAEICVG
ncbi:unnamed protein product [Phytophthora fragariaefolia]|uniref:Unnamed protein product n=1 Tax=Phytophthora fragariaefolia TaxID=1490495 RepID=A0A9W6XMD5_9STRA|nr:unnamed protein product [Phytophthora fragariaefolia]